MHGGVYIAAVVIGIISGGLAFVLFLLKTGSGALVWCCDKLDAHRRDKDQSHNLLNELSSTPGNPDIEEIKTQNQLNARMLPEATDQDSSYMNRRGWFSCLMALATFHVHVAASG
ncbi:hypothetical protein GGR57DRAFT_506850 [Xylariaceae sp. FL1272]|nr:hypothetical protein GGR57DRAFT_506850 [Xylariaceae sp. FL1272]